MPRQKRADAPRWKGNVVLTDGETGNIIYDNRDVVAMAKWNIMRGGKAAESNDPKRWDVWSDIMRLIFQEQVWCYHCGMNIWQFIGSKNEGHLLADGETIADTCVRCTSRRPVVPYKNDQEKIDKAVIMKYIDEYIDAKLNKEKEVEIITRYIKEVKGMDVEEFLKYENDKLNKEKKNVEENN